MKIRSFALQLAVCTALFSAAAAQASDLAEVYARALQNDPQIREAEANRLATLESKPQALAALLPQLSAGAGYDRRKTNGTTPYSDGDGHRRRRDLRRQSDVDSTTEQLGRHAPTEHFPLGELGDPRPADKQVAQAEVDYQAAQQDLILRTAGKLLQRPGGQGHADRGRGDLRRARAPAGAGGEAVRSGPDRRDRRPGSQGGLRLGDGQPLSRPSEIWPPSRSSCGSLPATPSTRSTDRARSCRCRRRTRPTKRTGSGWPWTRICSSSSSRIAAEIARDDISLQRGGHYPSVDLYLSRGNQDVSGDRRFSFTDAVPPHRSVSPLDKQHGRHDLRHSADSADLLWRCHVLARPAGRVSTSRGT